MRKHEGNYSNYRVITQAIIRLFMENFREYYVDNVLRKCLGEYGSIFGRIPVEMPLSITLKIGVVAAVRKLVEFAG